MAWLGGAAFVISLGWCAWTYAFSWNAARGSHFSPAAMLFDLLAFSVFAGHHSLAARPAVKRQLAQVVGEARLGSIYVWVASILLIAVCVAWRPVGGDVYAHGGLAAVPHLIVQAAGAWLIVSAVRLLDPLELAGIRQPGSRPLQSRGPYRRVRHPLYLGWILIAFGSAHMTADRLTFAAVTTTYLIVALRWEERSLAATFGAAYAEYARRVRWRVIPFLY